MDTAQRFTAEAFLVELMSVGTGAGASVPAFRYAALADTPDEALRIVAKLVSAGSNLRVLDERLLRLAAFTLGLRPGMARLV